MICTVFGVFSEREFAHQGSAPTGDRILPQLDAIATAGWGTGMKRIC